MAPQYPQEKAQLLTVALHGLAPACLTSLTERPFLLGTLCSSYSASLALSLPSTPLLPSALFHCLFKLLLFQEALLDSQTGLGAPLNPSPSPDHPGSLLSGGWSVSSNGL